MDTIGKRIEKLMILNKLTQRDLAKMVGVTPAAMCLYLKDDREPKVAVIENLATALGTTTDYLIRGEDDSVGFNHAYRIVARCKTEMTSDEKLRIIEMLLKK